jgi:hypothetical protein
MATEPMIKVDGKPIKASEMPKNCYMIGGEWYTEKGLLESLSEYKRLWEANTVTTTDTKKKSKSQVTQTPLSGANQDATTVK